MVKRAEKNLGMKSVLMVLGATLFIIYYAHFGSFFLSESEAREPLIYAGFLLIAVAVVSDYMIGVMLIVILMPFKIKFLPPYVSVREAIGWVTFASWFFNALTTRKLRVRFEWPEKMLLILLLLSWLAKIAGEIDTPAYTSRMLMIITGLFFYFFIVSIMDRYKLFDQVFLMLTLSGLISTIYGMYTIFLGQTTRMYALSKDPNYLAMLIMLPVPYLILKVVRGRRLGERFVSLLAVLVLIAGIAFTGSRSRIVTLPIILFILALLEVRKIKWVVLIVIILVSLVMFRYLPTQMVVERVQTLEQLDEVEEADDPSLPSRLELVRLGLKVISRYPLFGVGTGAARIYDPDNPMWGKVLHNSYLQLAAETGIPALLLYLLFFFLMLRSQWRLREKAVREDNEELFILSTALFAGLIIFMLGGLTMSMIWDRIYFLWFGLAIGLSRLEIDKEEALTAAGPPHRLNGKPEVS